MSGIGPAGQGERDWREGDYFLLWAGAAIALTEIWAGGMLSPLGLPLGLAVIVLGHVIGNTPMALGGLIGSRHGVPAIVSTRGALGNRGSILPAVLNIIQLVGWTAVMIWIGGQAAASLGGGGRHEVVWKLALGALTTLWALVGGRSWRLLQRAGVLLLLVLSAGMTVLAVQTYGWRDIWSRPPAGGMSFIRGLDLVIAMPISWMPLVADYARYSAEPGRGFWGTWWGYFIAGCWMYAVGLLVAVATGSGTPEMMLLKLMGEHRLLLPAVAIVLLSTVTTTFLDIYSNAVSIQSLWPCGGLRPLVLLGGAAGTLLALFFDAAAYEGFLLFIGSAFCPLFGVVLADYFICQRGQYVAEDLFQRGRYWYSGGVNWKALAAWAAGWGIYRWSLRTGFAGGGSLPALLGAALLYWAICRRRKENQR